MRSLSQLNLLHPFIVYGVVLSLETFLEKKWRIGYPSSSSSCPLSHSRCYFSCNFLLLRCQVPSSLLLLISDFLLYPSIRFHKDKVFFCSSTGFCNKMKRVSLVLLTLFFFPVFSLNVYFLCPLVLCCSFLWVATSNLRTVLAVHLPFSSKTKSFLVQRFRMDIMLHNQIHKLSNGRK